MIITHKLQQMDLTHKQNASRVDVVQDDKYSRDVEFTLTENGVAWQIPDGTTAVVRYKKPDGTGGNYDTLPDGSTAYQINGNVLTVALAPQVCTVSGSVQLSVGLIKGNAEINTFSVNIVVHQNPGAEYQSEDYIRLSGAVPNSGWTPNIYLGTDAQGNVVAKEGTSGGGSTSGKAGGYYTPSVTQPDVNTMRVAFTPSDGSMPEVASRDVTLPTGANGKSAYQYAKEGGYTGTETEFSTKLAQEKFANPNALTFTGAVSATYDGSEMVTVDIPSRGGGQVFANDLLAEGTIASGLAAWSTVDTGLTVGDLRKYKSFVILLTGDITGDLYYNFGTDIGAVQKSIRLEWEDDAKTILMCDGYSSYTDLFSNNYKATIAFWGTHHPWIRFDFRNIADSSAIAFTNANATTSDVTYQIMGWLK